MSNKFIQLTLIIAIGSILFSLESFIPMPLPWIKLGLANITTILALKWYGLKETFIVVLLRIVIGSFLTGNFLNSAFTISFSGNIATVLIMYLTFHYGEKMISIVGVSILGAVFKNMTQLFIAYLIYLHQIFLFMLMPMFLFSALTAGILIGLTAYIILDKITPHLQLSN